MLLAQLCISRNDTYSVHVSHVHCQVGGPCLIRIKCPAQQSMQGQTVRCITISTVILCRALPSSLLLLSRAFTMTQPLAAPKKAGAEYEQLKDTISSLPSKVITEASMEAGHDE